MTKEPMFPNKHEFVIDPDFSATLCGHITGAGPCGCVKSNPIHNNN